MANGLPQGKINYIGQAHPRAAGKLFGAAF
jgi:hypothetical protein